jgi:glycosyltransferase involved in cell wall biosynthesis
MPYFSVVIPTYQRQDLLEKAVRSILAQTYQDFEIIIVDDGSPHPIKLEIPGENRIRIIRHEVNRGVSAARNTGIHAAHGDKLAWLDSDDLWLPDKLMVQFHYFTNNPDLQACVTGLQYVSKRNIYNLIPKKPILELRDVIGRNVFGPGSTLAARRECYDRVGYFDESMFMSEDVDWLIRFVQIFRLGTIQEPLAVVRYTDDPPAWKIEISHLKFIEKHRDLILSLGKFYGTRIIGEKYIYIGIQYCREGNKRKGGQYIIKGIRENPLHRPGIFLRIFDCIFGSSIFPWLRRFV